MRLVIRAELEIVRAKLPEYYSRVFTSLVARFVRVKSMLDFSNLFFTFKKIMINSNPLTRIRYLILVLF